MIQVIKLPPGGNSFICHDLLEADCESFSEESLTMFALSIKFPLAEFDTIFQENLQLSTREDGDHPSKKIIIILIIHMMTI